MFEEVVKFWFEEIEPKQWWIKDAGFDALIKQRFDKLHAQASKAELYAWRITPKGRLAEIIVLDQFSRNMFRDQAQAFASDPIALILSQEAIAAGADCMLNEDERTFMYMPYMHSESLAMHEVALGLFQKGSKPSNVEFELRHKAIIERYGRYPHRNAILGRLSTPEEIAFLKQPGSSF